MAIKSHQFTKAIKEALELYTDEIIEQIDDETDRIARRAIKDLKASSPNPDGAAGTGYAKNWKFKATRYKNAPDRYVIYNDKTYRLAHLLEYGHVKSNGTGRTKAYPHIKEIEDQVNKDFEKSVREVIRNGS